MYIHESTHKLYHLCVTTEKFCCNLFIEFYVYEYGIVLKADFILYKLFIWFDMLLNAMVW